MRVRPDTLTGEAQNFSQSGFYVLRNQLSASELLSLRQLVDEYVGGIDPAHRARYQHHGSMLALDYTDARLQQLISKPGLHGALGRMGLRDARWLSGYAISKPPGSPRLWWHQDWFAWDDPLTLRELPVQFSVMIYLDNTAEGNGALRVIPGSHREPHPLHGLLPDAHGDEIESLPDGHPAYADWPEEELVAVDAGDLVICDIRLLHATHSNRSHRDRHCITLWFIPEYAALPERMKSYYAQHPCQPSPQARRQLPPQFTGVLPEYQWDGGGAEVMYRRQPSIPMLTRLAAGAD